MPTNAAYLMDGVRYDINNFTLWLDHERFSGEEDQKIPAQVRPFFDTGMYVVVPDEPYLVGRKYSTTIFPIEDYPDIPALGAAWNILDYTDETPPTVGQLRITGEVFKNSCGAHALYLEDSGTHDDFRTGSRLPILVTMTAGDKQFQTVTGTFGRTTNRANQIVISKAPYLGECITDEGLETLDFKLGEEIKVTMTVYDYAGHPSEPVAQTIKWPIRETGSRSNGSGCSISDGASHSSATLVAIAILALLIRARNKGCQRPDTRKYPQKHTNKTTAPNRRPAHAPAPARAPMISSARSE